MTKVIIIIIGVLLFIYINTYTPDDYPALIKSAKQGVRSNFKDPYSAKFEGIFISKDMSNGSTGVPFVCGTVNAKNGFGAYTGRQKFYYYESRTEGPKHEIVDDTPPLPEVVSVSISSQMYTAFCSNKIDY